MMVNDSIKNLMLRNWGQGASICMTYEEKVLSQSNKSSLESSSQKMSVPDALNLAMEFQRQQNFSFAEELYRRILTVDDAHFDALHMLGATLNSQGKWTEALRYLQQAAQVNNSISALHNNFGLCYRHLGNFSKSIQSHKAAIELAPQSALAWNNLGVAYLNVDIRESLICFMNAMRFDRKYVRAFFNFFSAQWHGGKYATFDVSQSISEFEALVDELESDAWNDAEALGNLGICFAMCRRMTDAHRCFTRALVLDPHDSSLNIKYGIVLMMNNDFERAEQLFEKVVGMHPHAALELGILLTLQGDYRKAHQYLVDAFNANQSDHLIQYNLSISLLRLGKWSEGFALYESRHRLPAIRPFHSELPLWNGFKVINKSILIFPDQGLGDCIQMFRFFKQLRLMGFTQISFVCYPALVDLLAPVDWIDIIFEIGASPTPHDFQASIMSLPYLLRVQTEDDFFYYNYLAVPSEFNAKWDSILYGKNKKVGLVWAGNPNHSNDKNRSCPYSEFRKIICQQKFSHLNFYLLQHAYAERLPEITDASKFRNVTDLSRQIESLADTAAIVDELDLVITIDSAVAHLAGALGKSVWMLCPKWGVDWRWMSERSDSPWYESMTIIRQDAQGGWGDVMTQISNKLGDLFDQD